MKNAGERKDKGQFIVEGKKEIGFAMNAGFQPVEFFHYPELGAIAPAIDPQNYFTISKDVFEKIAYREGTDGLLAVFNIKKAEIESIRLSECPLIIVLEAVEKPGNLGAVLRTADACKADAVIICDPKTDMYNPNVIRSSVGCLFNVQTAVCTTEVCMKWLKEKKIGTYAAALSAKKLHTESDLSVPCAIILGTEATGLSDQWLKHGEQIRIPMLGKNDSLNVSTAAAVIVFEAIRQRKAGK